MVNGFWLELATSGGAQSKVKSIEKKRLETNEFA